MQWLLLGELGARQVSMLLRLLVGAATAAAAAAAAAAGASHLCLPAISSDTLRISLYE
jgi:hypothetical protein